MQVDAREALRHLRLRRPSRRIGCIVPSFRGISEPAKRLPNLPLSVRLRSRKAPEEEPMMHRVLITGAGGGIGRSLRETLRGVYPVLRVSDRVPLAPARPEDQGREEVDKTDIADMAAVEQMVAGVDGIVHLGGISGENSWEKILEGNIVGLYNVFEAARRAGVKRIVMATSNHAVGFYPRSQRSTTGSCRAPTAATASRRRSRKRSPAFTPTSTASVFCAPGSAISRQSRSTAGVCRSGSARATTRS